MVFTPPPDHERSGAMTGCPDPLPRAAESETGRAARRLSGNDGSQDRRSADLLEVVDLAYGEDDDALNPFLSALRKLIPFVSGVLMPVSPDSWQLQRGWFRGCTAGNLERYLEQDYRFDPLIAAGPGNWSLNDVIHWPELLADNSMPWSIFNGRFVREPVDHALSALCGYRGHPTVLFRLFRTAREPAFGAGDVTLMASLARHLGRAVHLRQLLDRPELALPRGILVIGDRGEALYQSAGCRRIVGKDPSAMESLLAQAGANGIWFSARLGLGYRMKPIHLDHGSLLACYDAVPPETNGPSVQPEVVPKAQAFALEPIVQRSDLRKRLMGHGLTARELEIGLLVVQGLQYKVIARSLNITEQTVKDHLRSVFKKVGVRSGGALVARIVGVQHLRFMGP